MGLPARKFEAEPFRRAHLQVVPDPPARPARRTPAKTRSSAKTRASVVTTGASRTRVRADEAQARNVFTMFITVMLAVLVIGGVRVAFVARAAEASLSESRLRTEIRAARAERDKLEVEKSSLSSPSRIAGIAESSMSMGQPRSVRYVTIDTASANTPSGEVAQVSKAGMGTLSKVVDAVMALSAGEAQSLLVGDLGLAGSR